MRILYSPQQNNNMTIDYSFTRDTITATVGEKADSFDLSFIPDGEGIPRKMNGSIEINTTLPFMPIENATRIDGVLNVTLINFIREDASEIEKYPDWIEV